MGEAYIDVHKLAFDGVKRTFKKVMESELLAKVMMVAQFILIPIVQVVASGYIFTLGEPVRR